MKRCSRCKELKTLCSFSKNKKGKNGLYCHCKVCQRQTNRTRYNKPNGQIAKHADGIRRYWRHLNRDAAVKEYDKLKSEQDSKCKICNLPESEIDKKYNKIKYLCVDHNHQTMQVRGLLCSRCNRGIGQLKDNAALCYAAALYLEKFENS